MAILDHIKTSGTYVTSEVRVRERGISMLVGKHTGNWYPEGKPWSASIYASVTDYANADNWSFGLSAFGATRIDAVIAAYEFAQSKSVKFPVTWLMAVIQVIEEECHDS